MESAAASFSVAFATCFSVNLSHPVTDPVVLHFQNLFHQLKGYLSFYLLCSLGIHFGYHTIAGHLRNLKEENSDLEVGVGGDLVGSY